MTRREHLRKLRYLACVFVQDHAAATQTAAEIGTAVAALNGVLSDDGKAIAFAAAALLAASCAGMRQFAFIALENEITTAMGDRP